MRREGRRHVAAGVAASLAAAVVVGWLVLRDRPVAPVSPGSGWSARIVAALSAPTAPDEALVAGPAAAPLVDEHGPEERQVCGGGWVKVGADGNVEGEMPENEAEVASLRQATIARLRNDPDEYARAVGVWMGAGNDDAALVGMALGTRDPKVYSLAFLSCRRSEGASGPCALLGTGQWSRLDPGNAAPWLFALVDAAARNDKAGVDEALFQIGNAERSSFDLFGPLGPVLDAAPSGDSALLAAWGVASQGLGVILATPFSYVSPLLGACRGEAVADTNRRQACERVADRLTDRSDDLMSSRIASRLLMELTGSADRRERQRVEMNVWTASMNDDFVGLDALGCPALRRSLDRLRAQADLGEAGVMRQWIAQSGLSPKDLLDRSRAFDAQFAAAGARAASAAEAASAASGPS